MSAADTSSSSNKKKSLHQAALEGDLALVRELIEANKSLVNSKDEDARVPLHWAASGKHIDVARYLLDSDLGEGKPTVTAKDESDWTPLMIAVSVGADDIVELLLKNGADPNVGNEAGVTALHYAASKNRLDSGALLLANTVKANPNARDKLKQTPLHRAAGKGYEVFCKLLLDNGAKIDPADTQRKTPLHLACEEGHGAVAVMLVERGADPDAEDEDGKRPVELAPKNVRSFVERVIL